MQPIDIVCRYPGCGQIFIDCRILPCGQRVCASHVAEMLIINPEDECHRVTCHFCSKTHFLAIGDQFPVDPLLKQHLDSADYKQAVEHLASLKAKCDQWRAFDKAAYTRQHFARLAALVDEAHQKHSKLLTTFYNEIRLKVTNSNHSTGINSH